MAETNKTFDAINNVASAVGTKFWDALMSNGEQQLASLGPAVSDPSPTVVIGGEAHTHVDDEVRSRCEAECLDCENDLDGCNS